MSRDLLQQAISLHRQGQLSAAELLYRRLLDFDLLHMFGVLRAQQGHSQEALDLMGAALQAMQRSAPGLSDRGEVLAAVGRHEEAVAHFDAALEISPRNALILTLRGNTLVRMGDLESALESYEAALAMEPALAQALNDRGSALYALGRYGDALASYDSALQASPGYAQALSNRGQTLLRTGKLEAALADFDHALQIFPADPGTLTNRGVALREMMRLEDALASFCKAVTVDPGYANAYYNAAHVRLLSGDLMEGWRLYEWRKRLPAAAVDTSRYQVPAWTGREPLAGKVLFLYSDQGLGDAIQFIRYALLAHNQGARVIVAVRDSLRRLLGHSLAGIEIWGSRGAPERFDYQAALMSLPLAFGTTLNSIPDFGPYLKAEPALSEAWRRIRIGDRGFKIGIAWQGRPDTNVDIGRSVPLHHFARLARIPGVRLISLQKGAGLEQIAALPPGTIETLPESYDGGDDAFLDCAAIMDGLDLVISSDTAIAHLAGAMGRPVWVALQHVPEWRWLLNRDDSPWYSTMTLFRQGAPGEWGDVFMRMETALTALLERGADEK